MINVRLIYFSKRILNVSVYGLKQIPFRQKNLNVLERPPPFENNKHNLVLYLGTYIFQQDELYTPAQLPHQDLLLGQPCYA